MSLESLSKMTDTSALLSQYAATNRFQSGRPTQLAIAPDGKTILFLRSGARNFVQDLYEHDALTGRERLLLAAKDILKGDTEELTEEERARRERTRMAFRGFSGFELSSTGERLLACLGHRLLLLNRSTGEHRELIGDGGPAIDAHLSPNGHFIACVRRGDLYVTEIGTNSQIRLTCTASDKLTNGLAEFVAQEEMHRMNGYWWSPDSSMLAYQETNESAVEQRYIPDLSSPLKPPTLCYYPRAGTANSRVRLGLVPASGGSTIWVSWDCDRYPYLATVKWPKQGPLLILVQNREQTREILLRVDPLTGSTVQLICETDPLWLSLDQKFPYWLDDGLGFLWMTEREGGRQLELRNEDGGRERALTRVEDGFRRLLHVDQANGFLWVLGGKDPTQVCLASVSLNSQYQIEHFEETNVRTDQSESVFSEDNDLMVQSVITDFAPSRWHVRQRKQSTLTYTLSKIGCLAEAPIVPLSREFVEVGHSPSLHASIVRPLDFLLARKYPVIVFVYGGPGAQVVKVGRPSYLLDQWIANQGFVVVSIDGRGTPSRDREFERAIKGDCASLPLEDQVTGLRCLGERFLELDLTRVGIFGWSFGGYLSAMAVMRRPDIFHAAVCGASVTDFREYDTHYTERYLGLPQACSEAYDVSSLHTYANRLQRPLLIIHGTADDNCYFSGSLQLSNTLFRAGINHEFLPLCGEKHMIANPDVVFHLYKRLLLFFRRHIA